MKRMRKLLAILMVAILLAATLAACDNGGKGKDKNGTSNGGKKVEISFWNSGLGTDYMDKMIEAFNSKQSEWEVYYNAVSNASAAHSTYYNTEQNTVDLYMNSTIFDPQYMVTLDDVLDSVADGDKKPLKEKFNASYLEDEKAKDGHYYTLTWGGGAVGIVYNKAAFEKAKVTELPRTTDELSAACDKLLSAKITPTIHFDSYGQGGYWPFMQDVWQSQYDGFDYYKNNFYGATDSQGKSPSKELFTEKKGQYQVVKAMESFITPEYVFTGSNSQDFITAQTTFLNSEIGMMVNGSWMANEMKGVADVDGYGVMKAPVISAITDKLTTVKSDMLLRELVSAIDAVTDGKAAVSEYQSGDGYLVDGEKISAADWEYVKKARNSVPVNFPQQTMFIPSYSDAIEGAKEFIKFYLSDEGYKIFRDELHVSLPISLSEGELDTEGWSEYEKEMDYLYRSAELYISSKAMRHHDIFTSGGAASFGGFRFLPLLCTNNVADRVSADEAWEQIVDHVEQQYDGWLANIK